MSRYIGNYLRVPSSEPQQASASGIWSINEQLAYQRANLWPPARDPYYNQTVLHLSGDVAGTRETNPVTQPRTFLSDASTNNFLLTPNGDVSARPFSPYASSYSNYFDGTGDYLSVAANSAFDFASGNFTIEAWINKLSSTYSILFDFQYWYSYNLRINSNNAILSASYTTAGSENWNITSANNIIIPNIWNHVALVRNGSSIRIYVNGNSVASGTFAGSISNTVSSLRITHNDSGVEGTGYISNLRIVKGTAVYTTNFTPPTTPLENIAGTSLLTCQANRFKDNSSNNFTVTPAGNVAVAQNSPFVDYDTTSGSGYFDGTDDYVATPSNAAFGFSGTWTIECWFYVATTSGSRLWQISNEVDNCEVNSPSAGYVNYYNGSSSVNSSAAVVVPFSWTHLAAVCTANSTKVYVNGVLAITHSTSNTTARSINIGGSSNLDFLGYISNFRVVKGTAVYTGNFTPPTAPITNAGSTSAASYPNTTNVNTSFAESATSLLTLQTRAPANNQGILDSSPNSFVVTRNGNVAQGSFSPFSQSGWSNYYNGYAGTNLSLNPGTTIGAGQFSVESWIYPQPQPASGQAYGTQTIIFQGNNSNNNSWSLSFDQSTMRISWGYYGAGTTVSASYLLSFNIWSHILVTRDSSNIERIFINGTLVNQRTNTQSYTGVNGTTIRLGSHLDSNWPGAYSLNQFGLAFCGYMSNTRVIAGNIPVEYQTTSTTLGTVIFTPSTSRLTNIAGTILLANQSNRFIDNSNYNSAITINYSTAPGVSVQPFSPFAPTQAYVASQLGGSAYFDGNDYLSVSDNAAFTLGTNSFTAEAWVYPTTSSVARMIMGQYEDTDNTGSFLLYLNSGNKLVCIIPALAITITGATNVPASAWSHVVITRSGSSFAIFLNGSRDASLATNSGALTDSTYAFTLGADRDGNSLLYTGYIASARLVNGTAVYDPTQTTITVPTSPPTAVPGTSLLLNFTGAGIVDSTGRNVVETVGNSAVQTTQSRWPPGSMYFDGTADYLQSSIGLSELVFLHNGTSWTVDGWFYTGSTSEQYILSTDAASASIGMGIGLNNTSTRDIVAQIYRGVSGSWVIATSPTNSWNLNTWTHFAVTFDSSKNLTVYINGVQVAAASGSSFAFSTANPSYPLVVGRFQAPTPGGYFNGYISDLRVTRGYARYITGTGGNANQMVFNGTNTLAFPTINTRPFPLA